jgi:hypothetical protein
LGGIVILRVINLPFRQKWYVNDETGEILNSRGVLVGNYFTDQSLWTYAPPGWEEAERERQRIERERRIAEEHARLNEISRIEFEEQARLNRILAEEQQRAEVERIRAAEAAREAELQESLRVQAEEVERIRREQLAIARRLEAERQEAERQEAARLEAERLERSSREWITARDLAGQTGTQWVGQGEGDVPVEVSLATALQRDFDDLWPRYLPALGFSGPVLEHPIIGEATGEGTGTPIYGEQMTAAARAFIARIQAAGYDMVAYAPHWQARHRTFGIRTPTGDVVGQTTIDTGNDFAEFFRGFLLPVFGIAGGFAFLGQQAAAITGLQPQTAASIIRTTVNVAAGGDIERSLIGTIAPAVIAEYGPTTILSPPELGPIEPELLEVESVAVELAQELPPELPLPDILPVEVAELLMVPDLLPVEPVQLLPEPEPIFEPVFEPLPELPPELLPPPEPIFEPVFEPLLELPPELLPLPEPIFEPVFEPLPELIFEPEPLPDLPPEPLPPTIEPPGVPTMDDFFTADDYDFRDFGSLDFGIDDGYFFDGTFPGMDFDTVEPIPTVDAGDWFIGPMPLPDFPAIDADDTWTMPVTGGEVSDLVTVGDINVITTDLSANYIGTGGTVETSTPAGATVVEILKDATGAMVAALGLVNAYRNLTSKPAPNPVAQARQGANTVRANPNGTITTTTATGQTRTARPPVGQPQMTTDGTMIINNGDGTYTRIGRDGASVINRYPVDVTERFGAVAASPYTLPLLIGGAALALFAARKR